MKFIFKSFAKLNLYLEVLNKRPDGYHNILTVFQMIDLYDEIYLSIGGERISVTCSNPDVPEGEENLVYRAIKLFMESTGMNFGIDVHINKNIPVGGGLGGGSSNAVSTLMALNRIFKRPLSMVRLKEISDKLGSDTSFFLYGGTVLSQGRGEKILEILPTPQMFFILYYPGFSVDTGEAYRSVYSNLTKPAVDVKFLIEGLKESDIGTVGANLFNHFAPLLMEVKEIKEVYSKLVKTEDVYGVGVTGSGSCIFALMEKRDVAENLLPKIQGSGKCWLCRSVSSAEYVEQFNQMED